MNSKYLEHKNKKLEKEYQVLSEKVDLLEFEIINLQDKLKKIQSNEVLDYQSLIELISKNKLCRYGLYIETNKHKRVNKIIEYILNLRIVRIYFKKYIPSFYESLYVLNNKNKKISNFNNKSIIKNINNDWVNKYEKTIERILDSNGCKYYSKFDIKIGIICDEIYFNSIENIANFTYLTPTNWKNQLSNIDAFMIVSTWRGLNEEWLGLANKTSINKIIVLEILDYCKNNNIKSIFYSKEDPPSYEQFLDYAKKCDYILTSDNGSVENYKKDCKNNEVYTMSFCINPTLHNPIGLNVITNKEKVVLFSGSWVKKFPQRCEDLTILFDGIINSDYKLKIIDRNYPKFQQYSYPDKYIQYLSPSVDVKKLYKLHKLFDYAINVNSVKYSETMFANRVIELQACGILLFSNYNTAISNIVPTTIINEDSQELVAYINNQNNDYLYERKINNIRYIIDNFTSFELYNSLFQLIKKQKQQNARSILVILNTKNDRVLRMFHCQDYQNKTFIEHNKLTAEITNQYDIITWFNEKSTYDEFYLTDMINGFKYTNASFITKNTFYDADKLIQNNEHNYTNFFICKTHTIFWTKDFQYSELIELQANTKYTYKNGYSIDRFNYNKQIAEKKLHDTQYLISIIIPIYNTGHYLLHRLLPTLINLPLFKQLEIILVDDGSDTQTKNILSYINKKFLNVKLYNFSTSSGSASKPRNKGIEIATSKYIAFLDPDDDILIDGYSKLIQQAIDGDYDLCIGNLLKYQNNKKIKFNNYLILQNKIGDNILENVNFHAPNLQTMIIKKSLLKNNNLINIEGAVGEDTLLSWQLIYTAKNIKLINTTVYVYYGYLTDSITNNIKKDYFDKLLRLQKHKIKWLKSTNNLEKFMQLKYNQYTENWVFDRILRVKEEDLNASIRLVYEYLMIYNEFYNKNSILINKFIQLYNKKALAIEIINYIKEKKGKQ